MSWEGWHGGSAVSTTRDCSVMGGRRSPLASLLRRGHSTLPGAPGRTRASGHHRTRAKLWLTCRKPPSMCLRRSPAVEEAVPWDAISAHGETHRCCGDS